MHKYTVYYPSGLVTVSVTLLSLKGHCDRSAFKNKNILSVK